MTKREMVRYVRTNMHETETDLAKRLGVKRTVVRAARVAAGIDRKTAILWAKARLAVTPRAAAAWIIKLVRERFGIRLGPPDVTRMRPKRYRRQKAARKKVTR